MVVCVHEKSQIPALNRTLPTLPMGLGYVEGYTHDLIRHARGRCSPPGDIVTGEVFGLCRGNRSRRRGFSGQHLLELRRASMMRMAPLLRSRKPVNVSQRIVGADFCYRGDTCGVGPRQGRPLPGAQWGVCIVIWRAE